MTFFEDGDVVKYDVTMDIVNELHGHVNFNCISKCYDITNHNSFISQEPNKLNILHMNSRSLPMSFDESILLFNSFPIP